MRQRIIAMAIACVCALSGALVAKAEDPGTPDTSAATTTDAHRAPTPAQVQRIVDRYRRITWRWQRVMGRPVTLRLAQSREDPLERIEVWKRIAVRTARVAQHPPHAYAWQCIHRYEGDWRDPYAPYYGGLQMDIGFQRTYGGYLLARKGTADNWTPLEQMWVAERAFRAGRGFYPWPNTARYCGLL